MTEKKLFSFLISETFNEREGLILRAVHADTEEEARAFAFQYLQDWYGSPEENTVEGDTVYYYHGESSAKIDSITPTNMDDLISELLDRTILPDYAAQETTTTKTTLTQDLLSGCIAAIAYLAPPASRYKTNRDAAVRIITNAIKRAQKETQK